MARRAAGRDRGVAPSGRAVLGLRQYVDGVLAGDRAMLGRAVTLVESRNPEHRHLAQQVLTQLLPYSGEAYRIGISGIPGVGKSTFIDAFGTNLTSAGHRVAVLAVDPTSRRTGGSILGDKTRMARLSRDENAYIRPSPSAGTLGGVARATRETMIVCEAAKYDVILVETVGVGQSETVVSEMVDFFLLLMIAGGGDDLQGIKRGILELADLVAVNKAEGENRERALRAASEIASALHLMGPRSGGWTPLVVICSALRNEGLADIWESMVDHRRRLTESGELETRRRRQQVDWMWAAVEDRIKAELYDDPTVGRMVRDLELSVAEGRLTPASAAERIVNAFRLRG